MQRNPFTPTFGISPLVLAGRDGVLAEMTQAFRNGMGDPNLASIMVGARGVGKTALLSEIRRLGTEERWVGVSTAARPGMLDDLLQQTYRNAGHLLAPEGKRRLAGIEIAQLLGIQWETLQGSPENWRSKMTDLLEQLDQADAGLVITVDEVEPSLDEMKTLVSVYQHFVSEGRSVALVLAGLPHKVSSLLSDDSISYLRRARKHVLGRISDASVRFAFAATMAEGGKDVAPEALDEAVRAIQGFPYMLQLVGYWVWSVSGDKGGVDLRCAETGIGLARESMEEGVLESTFRSLSAGDKRFIAAMLCDDGTSALSDIAERMGVKSNYASRYKTRLLEQGIIGERGRNLFVFEIPASREYFAKRLSLPSS